MLMLRNGDSRESPTPSPWATRHAWPQGFEQAIRARGSRSPGLRKVLPVVIQHDNHSMRVYGEKRGPRIDRNLMGRPRHLVSDRRTLWWPDRLVTIACLFFVLGRFLGEMGSVGCRVFGIASSGLEAARLCSVSCNFL